MQNLEIKHLSQASISSTQLTTDALARIAPSCITEVKDSKTGSIKHVVDFHVLRQLLGDQAVEDSAEAYQFTWVGKQEARREAAKSITKTLRPVPEDSVDWDNTQNIYIEGDNLEALKLLQKSYLGKVKMIYIDPPYNTGNDFVYHDDFKQSQSEYDEAAGNVDEEGNRLLSRSNNSSLDDAFKKNTDSNGRFHSDWCSMIYSRLMIARSLLTEDGVIFISIDDNEVENLRKICDEVFGESNFLGCLTIIVKPEGRRYGTFAKCHELCLVYAKEHERSFTNEISIEGTSYQYQDRIGGFNLKGLRNRNVKAFNSTNRPNLRYPFFADTEHPDQNKLFPVTTIETDGFLKIEASEIDGLKSVWRWGKETAELKKDELVAFKGSDGNFRIFQKERKLTQTAKTVWNDIKFISNKGTKEVADILGKSIFDFHKPVALTKQMIQIGADDDSLILDFFSGSATTAHAVMQLNAEDGGNRRFIMVQLPEETAEDSEAYKAGYKNICEIGKERIRRAGAKIKEELAKSETDSKGKEKEKGLFDGEGNGGKNGNGNENGNGEASSASSKVSSLDTGFRVFRIDSGNMKDVEQSPSDVAQTELDWFIDNVKDDRTELDLLFGCMLNWGVQLSLPMSMETVDGCNIYTVNEGDLVACLTKDKPVTENIVRAIAEKSPLRVLFRDGSFASDAAKINIFEQFKQLMDWSDDEIIKNVRVL